MLTPKLAAKALLTKAAGSQVALSNLQLQKLIYLAHGVHLARHGQPLVSEQFQAWRYGPVNENLYHELKYFGSDPIPSTHPIVKFWGSAELDIDSNKSISDVVDAFGELLPQRLVGITHDSDGPWAKVYKEGVSQIEIPNDDIQRYFETRLKKKN